VTQETFNAVQITIMSLTTVCG